MLPANLLFPDDATRILAVGASTLVIAILSFTFSAIVIASRIAAARRTQREHARGWRVRRVGRDEMVYEDLDPDPTNPWRRLDLSGELLTTRTPGFVIYFESAERWSRYPPWASDRRDEIIARIQEACPAPRYEHDFEN